MISMFENCSALKLLNLSNFSVNCLINMDYMISKCSSLEIFIPPNFSNQKNDISMKHMIEYCYSLKKSEISLSKKNIDIEYMLEGCDSIKDVIFYRFNNNLLNIKKIFGNSQKKYIIYSKNKKLNLLCN